MPRRNAGLFWLYKTAPPLRPIMSAVNMMLRPPSFAGWGMSNYHALPWEDDEDWEHFRAATVHIRDNFEHGLPLETGVTPDTVDDLRWRHWFAAISARYCCVFADGTLNMVECGVGDGLTAYFACNEARHLGRQFTMHCYDVWAEVSTDVSHSSYSDLSVGRTRRNLRAFPVIYHAGIIPTTFDASSPQTVNYLSIDLNAAAPTIATLEFFLPRLAPRAVVLFDDYGHRGYMSTRRAVDQFVVNRRGVLMKLPTGQALWLT